MAKSQSKPSKRINGEGSIFVQKRKRKDGTECETYVGEVLIGYDDNGKKKVKRMYGKSREEVSHKIKNILVDQYQGKLVMPSSATVGEYISSWLNHTKKIELRKTTFTIYTMYIEKYIIPQIGNIKIQELETRHIQEMINSLYSSAGVDTKGKVKKGLAPATLRKVKFILRQCMEAAIDDELITKNTAQKAKLPKVEKTEIKPLTVKEMTKIFEAAKQKQNMYIAILLDLATGMRRGELLALTWSNIDLTTGIINVNKQIVPIKGGTDTCTPKTKSSIRQVTVPEKIITQLKKHKIYQISQKKKCELDGIEYFDTDLVICQDNGKHFHPRDFANRFDRIQKSAGVEHRTVHDMRHTFASQLLSNGAYVSEVQKILGHVDAKTTLQNYAHILPGRQQEIANQINNILPI